MADGQYLEAATSFSGQLHGSPVFVTEGELWEAGDPFVKGREHLFRPPTVRSTDYLRTRAERRRVTSPVETATAAPGELRTTTTAPPAKATAAKPTTRKGAAEPSEV